MYNQFETKIEEQSYEKNGGYMQTLSPGMRKAITELKSIYCYSKSCKTSNFCLDMHQSISRSAQLIVFARDDDYFFGILHSRLHEVWALSNRHVNFGSRKWLTLYTYYYL